MNKVLKQLERMGFTIKRGDGSLAKIYPPDKTQPFYSCHLGEKSLHPLRRFAERNWSVKISI
jgi:hypothetical protein